jgi:hypothetical protein
MVLRYEPVRVSSRRAQSRQRKANPSFYLGSSDSEDWGRRLSFEESLR